MSLTVSNSNADMATLPIDSASEHNAIDTLCDDVLRNIVSHLPSIRSLSHTCRQFEKLCRSRSWHKIFVPPRRYNSGERQARWTGEDLEVLQMLLNEILGGGSLEGGEGGDRARFVKDMSLEVDSTIMRPASSTAFSSMMPQYYTHGQFGHCLGCNVPARPKIISRAWIILARLASRFENLRFDHDLTRSDCGYQYDFARELLEHPLRFAKLDTLHVDSPILAKAVTSMAPNLRVIKLYLNHLGDGHKCCNYQGESGRLRCRAPTECEQCEKRGISNEERMPILPPLRLQRLAHIECHIQLDRGTHFDMPEVLDQLLQATPSLQSLVFVGNDTDVHTRTLLGHCRALETIVWRQSGCAEIHAGGTRMFPALRQLVIEGNVGESAMRLEFLPDYSLVKLETLVMVYRQDYRDSVSRSLPGITLDRCQPITPTALLLLQNNPNLSLVSFEYQHGEESVSPSDTPHIVSMTWPGDWLEQNTSKGNTGSPGILIRDYTTEDHTFTHARICSQSIFIDADKGELRRVGNDANVRVRHEASRTYHYVSTSDLRWSDCTSFDGVTVPRSVLEEVYGLIGEDAGWFEGGRALEMPVEAWDRLRRFKIELNFARTEPDLFA